MACNNCNKDKFIVNKKHNLCDDCNFERLHDGKSKSEVYSERAKEKQDKKPFNWYDQKLPASLLKKKPILIKTKVKIKQQTAKQAEVSIALSQLKKEIEIEALQSDSYFCWGCGCAKGGLDKSHILSVKQRKDLELVKDNINLFCRTCHNDWESWDIVKMIKLISFEKDLQFIKQNDKSIYNKIYGAIEYWILNVDNLQVEHELLIKIQHIYQSNDYLI